MLNCRFLIKTSIEGVIFLNFRDSTLEVVGFASIAICKMSLVGGFPHVQCGDKELFLIGE